MNDRLGSEGPAGVKVKGEASHIHPLLCCCSAPTRWDLSPQEGREGLWGTSGKAWVCLAGGGELLWEGEESWWRKEGRKEGEALPLNPTGRPHTYQVHPLSPWMLMTLSGDSLYTHFLRQGGSSDLDNNSLLCAAEKANQFSCLSLWEELLAYFISTLLALLRKIRKVRRRLNYLI